MPTSAQNETDGNAQAPDSAQHTSIAAPHNEQECPSEQLPVCSPWESQETTENKNREPSVASTSAQNERDAAPQDHQFQHHLPSTQPSHSSPTTSLGEGKRPEISSFVQMQSQSTPREVHEFSEGNTQENLNSPKVPLRTVLDDIIATQDNHGESATLIYGDSTDQQSLEIRPVSSGSGHESDGDMLIEDVRHGKFFFFVYLDYLIEGW